MKSRTKFYIFIIFLFSHPSILLALPGNGLGLALEGGLKVMSYDNEKDFQSSELYGFSLDYQWQISQSFSFSILSFEHGGKSKIPPKSDYEYYKLGFVGAEIKAWMGSLFFGIHSGQYYVTWIESISSFSGISMIGGNGFGLGFETKSGLFFAAYKEKSGVIKFGDMIDQKVEGSRIMLGYRWI